MNLDHDTLTTSSMVKIKKNSDSIAERMTERKDNLQSHISDDKTDEVHCSKLPI